MDISNDFLINYGYFTTTANTDVTATYPKSFTSYVLPIAVRLIGPTTTINNTYTIFARKTDNKATLTITSSTATGCSYIAMGK